MTVQETEKRTVLITNDDGYQAPGITALYRELKKEFEVFIVAPERESSAIGHAITVFDPIRAQEIYENGHRIGYFVTGTPADCVKLAIAALLEKKPNLVVSGINCGPNTCTNLLYSGTVSAATEGTILGIPSIAISLASRSCADYGVAARFARILARRVIQEGLPAGTMLNVNVPALPEDKIKGVKVTRQGTSRFRESFIRREDPSGRTYYWLDGEFCCEDEDEDVDVIALQKGYISITPIKFDLTDYELREKIRHFENISLEIGSM